MLAPPGGKNIFNARLLPCRLRTLPQSSLSCRLYISTALQSADLPTCRPADLLSFAVPAPQSQISAIGPVPCLACVRMPTEHRKRGRREEKKRKRDQHDADQQQKRHKPEDHVEDVLKQYDDTQQYDENHHDHHHDHHHADQPAYNDDDNTALDGLTRPGAMPFYGMLDEDEQEYFKRADEMLELNQFADAEERAMFLANVWKEADGKELKIANSQSCSRLMERLILLSTSDQLKRLFQKFSSQ